jgi:hypothetical protein
MTTVTPLAAATTCKIAEAADRLAGRFHNANAKHRYDVQVLTAGGLFQTWEIDANDRRQAARVATRQGAQVRSVNMVG